MFILAVDDGHLNITAERIQGHPLRYEGVRGCRDSRAAASGTADLFWVMRASGQINMRKSRWRASLQSPPIS